MAIVYLNEENLVAGLKNAESSAFEELVERYGDRLLRLCYLILKDKGAAEDIVQEIFIQIYKKIKTFKGNSSLYTWIYRITVNLCRNHMRKVESFTSMINDDEMQSSHDVEVESLVNIHRGKVKDIVFSMPQIYREVIVLFYYEDMTIKQICMVLDETENTIKSRLHRGRLILRDNLSKEGISYEG